MPYITREDGERFIIPSYRDTLSVKKTSLLKREIMLLSTNYGEYITLQKKNVNQYEVAFSPDPGYLLGECVWQYFKRPFDMIYCEAIPNSSEAILVIVKAGSVYLDGSFPIDSIVEELVVFKTQQNAFSIFIYGDVPISQAPEDGKIYFDASSVRSFTELDEPVFPTLPGVKAFQLQLVDVVLRSQGIGVIPYKQIAIASAVVLLLGVGYYYISNLKRVIPSSFVAPANPYQGYTQALSTPDPTLQLLNVYRNITKMYSMVGWRATSFDYTPGFPERTLVSVISDGAKVQLLLDWSNRNDVDISINPDGISLTVYSVTPTRTPPIYINRLNEVIANIIDRLSFIIPGNNVQIKSPVVRRNYSEMTVTVNVTDATPLTLVMIGNALSGLPLVLDKVILKQDASLLTGQLNFKALGN